MGSSDGDAVTTHGWDTAFVIPAESVNKAIVDKKSSPPNIQYQDQTASLAADFGDWQISPGGDGKNIQMSIPMSNLKLTYLQTGTTVSISSSTATVEIELEFLPGTDTNSVSDDPAGGTPLALKPKLTSDAPTDPIFDVIGLKINSSESIGLITQAMIQTLLQEWGNANLQDFNHIFAVVNVNRIVDAGWSFVTPSDVSYAYLDMGDSVDTSLFGVLCMTGSRNGTANNSQVPYNAIPDGSISGFLISQARTLYDLVRPAIMLAYPGLTGANFLMDSGQQSLYLAPGVTVDLKPVQNNGSNYTPKLTSFSVAANGSLLTFQSHTETEIIPGITAVCDATHWYTLELATSSKGQSLAFTKSQDPVITHTITHSPGSQITEAIILTVGAIVLTILTILTEGMDLVVGGLVVGLLMGAAQILPALIDALDKGDAPDVDLLLVNAVAPITWPDSGDCQLTYGQLNMSMQLGINPQFI